MYKIKINDIVEVISGDEKGKQGRLLRFNNDRSRAFIEKVNLAKKHTKPSQKNPTGGIQEKELSIHVSNLMAVDPNTKKAGRVGIKIVPEKTGVKRVRFMKETGTELK